jgi:hypothetical protein
MGRRSRARRAAAGSAAAPTPTPSPRPAPLTDERPKAPWHPFPLVELCVLLGIVLIVLAVVFGLDTDRGRAALLCGLVLASLGGLDTALREHFNGYRSHSTLLAGLPAVLVAGALFFASAPWIAVIVAGALMFAFGLWTFRAAFRRRSGGLSYRVK